MNAVSSAPPSQSAVSSFLPRKPIVGSDEILLGGFVVEKEPVSIPLFSSDGEDWIGPEWMTLRLAKYKAKRGITLESSEYRIEIKGQRLVKVILSIQGKKLARCSPSPQTHERDGKQPFIQSVEIIELEKGEDE